MFKISGEHDQLVVLPSGGNRYIRKAGVATYCDCCVRNFANQSRKRGIKRKNSITKGLNQVIEPHFQPSGSLHAPIAT